MRWRSVFFGGLLALALFGVAAAGQLEDGWAAYHRGDYAEAMRLWRPLAERGNADAQGLLGVMYGLGRGLPQDYVQAVSWTRKAADQGDVLAELSLGGAYEQGLGVPQDYQQAVIWYRKAADQGDANAVTALDRISRMVDGDEQQLVGIARQCSEAALRRYALSSTDPAEKVAQAAFNKCSDQWRLYAEVSGHRLDASPDAQEAHKNCIKYQGDKCPPRLPGSLYMMNEAEAEFTHKAATEVFDIRAEAAGQMKQ